MIGEQEDAAPDSRSQFRIVTWNLNHAFRGIDDRVWSFLDSLKPNIALLQEAKRPPIKGAVGSVIGGHRPWGSWIVPYRGTVVHEIAWAPLGALPLPAGHLEASHPGCFAVADADLPDGRVTVVSAYGMLAFKVRNGMRYAVTTIQRTLSDLTSRPVGGGGSSSSRRS